MTLCILDAYTILYKHHIICTKCLYCILIMSDRGGGGVVCVVVNDRINSSSGSSSILIMSDREGGGLVE